MKIRKLLKEKTRYEREFGQKYSPKYDFISKITEHPCDYAFTMVRIPKVGLNPKTDYNTPAGVYFYPLTQDYYYQLIENALPFASQSPYCGLVKLNWSDMKKWLIFDDAGGSNQDESAYDQAYDFFLNKYKKEFGDAQVFYDVEYKAATFGKHYKKHGVDGKIFDLTYFIANQLAAKKGTKVTIMWTNILRELGYIGLYDYGAGVIHPSEQTQLVCLEPSAYETIQVYETKDLRRGTDAEKARIDFQKQQREMQRKEIEFWNQILSQPVEKRIYAPPHGVFYTRTLTDLGLPISKLNGIKVEGSMIIDLYNYKGVKKVPDNITANGGISILDAEEMGKNITCKKLIIKEGLKQIPAGSNIKTQILFIDDVSNLTTIPNDIEFENLHIRGREFTHLPDNLKVPKDLDIETFKMRKLPKGLSVGGDLTTEGMFGRHMKPKEFLQNFPDDLQVGGYISGDFPWGDAIAVKLDEFNQQFQAFKEKVQQGESIKEVYKRWKKLV